MKGWSAWRVSLSIACALGFVGLVFLLYLSSVHSLPADSDGATVILEGKAMSAGNFMLNHWALSLDSFWLVDVPIYAVAVLIGGVHHQLLNLVPAIIAAAVVAAGAWIAQRGYGRWAGWLAAGTVVVILGLPTHALAGFLLLGPLHVATALWCLAAFVAVRNARFGFGWFLAVVLLAAGLLGDFQTLVLGVVPVGLAGIVAALRTRRWRAGAPAVAAALGSLVLGEVVRRFARAIGTFTIAAANPRAPFHQMIVNLRHVVTYGAALEGVGSDLFGGPALSPILQAAQVGRPGARCRGHRPRRRGDRPHRHLRRDGTAVERDAGRDRRETTFFEDALVFAFFGGCGTFIWLSFSNSIAFGRYLTAALIFGSILGGRLVGRLVELAGEARLRLAVAAVALVVAAGCAVNFADTLSLATPVQPASQLASYLEQHHLTRGIGDYWSASIVTVESSDAVVVRPVTTLAGGLQIGRYLRQSSSTWYGGGFQFLVYNAVTPWDDVEAQSAVASFGAPRHVAVVGRYRVLTWAHELTIPPDGTFAPQPWAHLSPT